MHTDQWATHTDQWATHTDQWATHTDQWATHTDQWATHTDQWATHTDQWATPLISELHTNWSVSYAYWPVSYTYWSVSYTYWSVSYTYWSVSYTYWSVSYTTDQWATYKLISELRILTSELYILISELHILISELHILISELHILMLPSQLSVSYSTRQKTGSGDGGSMFSLPQRTSVAGHCEAAGRVSWWYYKEFYSQKSSHEAGERWDTPWLCSDPYGVKRKSKKDSPVLEKKIGMGWHWDRYGLVLR